jgi:hypothetical protein
LSDKKAVAGVKSFSGKTGTAPGCRLRGFSAQIAQENRFRGLVERKIRISMRERRLSRTAGTFHPANQLLLLTF